MSTENPNPNLNPDPDPSPPAKPKAKAKISRSLREAVWGKYFTNNERSGPCVCCKTNIITLFNHECGHIVAESLGGPTTVDNLRPICRTCNLSMSTRHMDEFQATIIPKAVLDTQVIPPRERPQEPPRERPQERPQEAPARAPAKTSAKKASARAPVEPPQEPYTGSAAYTCPACGYQTRINSSMYAHLYTKKKHCPMSRRRIQLTDEIKEIIMVDRVYIAPATQPMHRFV